MLVCNVSLRPPRVGIAADIVEAIEAADATASGQVVFATLVDDPAGVLDFVDAYLGDVMLEEATAIDDVSASMATVHAADVVEAAAADSAQAVVAATPPVILPNLRGWWDASVAGSLTLSGSEITAVADQTGHGFTLIPQSGTTTTRPTYNATGLNSLPSMMFSAPSTQRLGALLTPAFNGATTMTTFFVGSMTSTSPANARFVSFTSSTASRDFNNTVSYAINRDGTNNILNFTRNSVGHTKAMTMNTPHRFIVTMDGSGNKAIYIDGVAATTTGTGAAFAINGTVVIGTTQWAADQAASLTGAVSEVGISADYCDAGMAALLDAYLAAKWGL